MLDKVVTYPKRQMTTVEILHCIVVKYPCTHIQVKEIHDNTCNAKVTDILCSLRSFGYEHEVILEMAKCISKKYGGINHV